MITDKWNIRLLRSSFSHWQGENKRSKQIAVLMSGGVDSSVSAHLLREAGWDVLGITMKIPISCNTNKRACCGTDAVIVCSQLDIPHYYIDVTDPFEELIIKPFRQSYARGETPNPCADCNKLLKFSLLWDFLKEKFGISFLATGHYARVSETNGRIYLGKAKDKAKDQSYFLYGIKSEKLARIIFPVGELTKKEVRSIAAGLNLTVAEKPESMELCFAAEGNYRDALASDQVNQHGDITDMQGNKIATHKGIANYTLGQRQGIGYAGGKPLYVGRIDPARNTIALGTREQVSFRTVRMSQVNVLIPEEFTTGRLFGKIRSYGEPAPCKISDIVQNFVTVEFDTPQFAPTPGQKLVLYNCNDNIVAGGTISLDSAGQK